MRFWIGVRRYTGDGPESPAHRTRNLRSLVLAAILAKCGAPLDRGLELHRSMSGVSGPSGPESPVCPDDPTCGAPLVPYPEGGWSLARISGPGRSLRCTYTGVSGLSGLQRLVFQGTYKRPPSSPFSLRFFCAARISLSLSLSHHC